MEVKSPYNFVPAPTEDQVFKPDWASQVSHDIPFEEGQSGELDITITAETPIFIRNGHSKPADGENPTSEFSHFIDAQGSKKYFIPATSIKGMLRNVLEIMSFSRMRQVEDDKFSIRDLSSNSNYYMTEMKSNANNKTHGGWLKSDKEGNWTIIDCGEPGRINHSELKEKFGLGFRDEFLNKEPKNDEAKTAKYKYEEALKQPFFKLENKFKTEQQDTRLKAFVDSDGETGTIVFTGQPGKRKEQGDDKKRFNGKYYEFVFFTNEDSNPIKLSPQQKKEFLFVYNDSDKDNISPDWKYWREKLEKGESIPVFFKKIQKDIKHFGLSYLYKLPLKKSIHETTPYNAYDYSQMDLAETIFGKTSEEYSLKGRVFISNAISETSTELQGKKEILGGPKASYLPFYLDQTQKVGVKYSNYNSTSILRGNKRYPVRNTIRNGIYSTKQLENKKVFSHFKPLIAGTIFKAKIRFHNLKKEEVGALISAITFHNTSKLSHNLGGLKAFGYGKVKIKLKENEFSNNIKWFENKMNQHCKTNWLESSQMIELLSMAKSPTKEAEFTLDYPQLENDKKENEFVKYKQPENALFLKSYSQINGIHKVETQLENSQVIEIKQKIEIAKANNDFVTIENSYNDLRVIDPSFDFSKNIEALNKLKIELYNIKILNDLIEKVIDSKDLELILSTISKYPLHPLIQILRSKEVELRIANKAIIAQNQANETLVFKDSNFESIKNTCNPFLKNKQFVFSEMQKKQIVNGLKDSYVFDSKKNKDEWNKNKGSYNKYPWTEIQKWLGEGQAKDLHTELTTIKP
jgi:CRISPR-associated protein (TIGR03986 family)